MIKSAICIAVRSVDMKMNSDCTVTSVPNRPRKSWNMKMERINGCDSHRDALIRPQYSPYCSCTLPINSRSSSESGLVAPLCSLLSITIMDNGRDAARLDDALIVTGLKLCSFTRRRSTRASWVFPETANALLRQGQLGLIARQHFASAVGHHLLHNVLQIRDLDHHGLGVVLVKRHDLHRLHAKLRVPLDHPLVHV